MPSPDTSSEFVLKYASYLGLSDISLLALYGTLSSILLSTIIIGAIAQVWKGRSGGGWALLALVVLTGSWIRIYGEVEADWNILALGISMGGGLLFVIVIGLMPGRKSTFERTEPSAAPSADMNLPAEPITPILPRAPKHGFRRKLFVPMVILGIIAFIGAGIMSVEKRQLDIFLGQLGITKAPPKAEKKAAKPTASKAKVKPMLPASDPTIARAQQLLIDLGYQSGPADGVAGKGTDTAVRKFQGREGLPRNGDISPDLIKRLEKVKSARGQMTGKTALEPDFQPHAEMCKLGIRAWYRSRTTQLSIDGVTQEIEKLSADITVWFSYPGEDMERVRATVLCKYSRYRGEMPEQPYTVTIKTGDAVEDLNDREVSCYSQGQPC